jgi:hypothetical protein
MYLHATTGEEAHLSASRVGGPGGELWWSVALVRAGGGLGPVAGQPAITWFRTREEARDGSRVRLAALRAEG